MNAFTIFPSLFLFVSIAFSPFAWTQEYPTRSLRLIVPFAAGGPTDIIGRAFGQRLGAAIGQPVIVDNRGGAAGTIGAQAAAKSAPDGYTLFMASFGFPLNPILFDDLGYDTIRDFSGVSLLAKGPVVVVVNPSLPVYSIKDFIAYAKARPGQLNYSSTGRAASGSLAILVLEKATGIRTTMINYKGAGPGAQAVISGEVHFAFPSIAAVAPFIKSGKLRALAVTSATRTDLLPNVPTIAEEAVPGYEEVAWYGILVPSGTPLPIITKLSQETQRVVKSPEMKKIFNAIGLDPEGSSPTALSQHIAEQYAKWSKELKKETAKSGR